MCVRAVHARGHHLVAGNSVGACIAWRTGIAQEARATALRYKRQWPNGCSWSTDRTQLSNDIGGPETGSASAFSRYRDVICTRHPGQHHVYAGAERIGSPGRGSQPPPPPPQQGPVQPIAHPGRWGGPRCFTEYLTPPPCRSGRPGRDARWGRRIVPSLVHPGGSRRRASPLHCWPKVFTSPSFTTLGMSTCSTPPACAKCDKFCMGTSTSVVFYELSLELQCFGS